MSQGDLQGVVIGIADRSLIRIASEIRTEWSSGAVIHRTAYSGVLTIFAEGTAWGLSGSKVGGIAQEQAQRWIAGIGFFQHQKTMPLVADVIHAENRVGSKTALERQHVLLGVRNAIAGGVVGQAGDRLELRPVNVGIGVTRA